MNVTTQELEREKGSPVYTQALFVVDSVQDLAPRPISLYPLRYDRGWEERHS